MIAKFWECTRDEDLSLSFNVGLILGSVLGNSLGVYLVGSIGDTEGSYFATILGTTIATIPTFVFIEDPIHEPYLIFYVLTIGAVLQDLGSIIGFNISRRYETPDDSGTALINFRDGRTSFTVPTVYFRPDPFGGRILVQNVDLVKMRF